jgi:hypothetical protein
MAGVTIDGGGGKRRSLDSELNMIPMIDLLMVTIAFLLVTAVWTESARLEANAKVPGPSCVDCPPPTHDRTFHVEMRAPDKFTLTWREGTLLASSVDVPRHAVVGKDGVHFPELAAAAAREWRSHGMHASPSDPQRDGAVLHTANDTPFEEMAAAMDALYAPTRPTTHGETPAFAVTLATQ